MEEELSRGLDDGHAGTGEPEGWEGVWETAPDFSCRGQPSGGDSLWPWLTDPLRVWLSCPGLLRLLNNTSV